MATDSTEAAMAACTLIRDKQANTTGVEQTSTIVPEKKGWYQLPAEIRLQILEDVASTHGKARAPKTRQLAALATVNKSWQEFFEGETFRNMILKSEDDIKTFATLVTGRRRELVRWIWLRVELPEYDCDKCEQVETAEEEKISRPFLTNLVLSLFEALSPWSTSETFRNGITLELSIHSPSDAQHFYRDLQHRINDTAWDLEGHDGPVQPYYDGSLGCKWIQDNKAVPARAEHISDNALLRVAGSPLHFVPQAHHTAQCLHNAIPEVSVVTSVVIRRQFVRRFCAGQDFLAMLDKLTRLEAFIQEPWTGPTEEAQELNNDCLMSVADWFGQKKTLKKVTIFESPHNLIYGKALHFQSHISLLSFAGLFGIKLLHSSQHLEELYVSHCIDAWSFFNHPFHPARNNLPTGHDVPSPYNCPNFVSAAGYDPSSTAKEDLLWPNLKRLSITSHFLAPNCRSQFYEESDDESDDGVHEESDDEVHEESDDEDEDDDMDPWTPECECCGPGTGGIANTVIRMAAAAAMRMPKLEIMEMWAQNPATGEACIFRYKRPKDGIYNLEYGATPEHNIVASIELISNWGARFSRQAVEEWVEVAAEASQRPMCGLLDIVEPLETPEGEVIGRGELGGRYAPLPQLELLDHVMHPVSLRQMREEDRRGIAAALDKAKDRQE